MLSSFWNYDTLPDYGVTRSHVQWGMTHRVASVLGKEKLCKHLYFRTLFIRYNALVNVNFPGTPLPWATQGILTGSIWPTQGFSLLLNHSGDIWQKLFNPGEFSVNSDPNLKELLHIFSLFHLLPANPHPLIQGFLTGNSLSVCPSHAPVLVFVWKHMCFVYYTNAVTF